jgi:hypothetical protein
MEVSTERSIESFDFTVTFAIGEYRWKEFLYDRYGSATYSHPSVDHNLRSDDLVGLMLLLLREFYLWESTVHSRVQKVNVETVEPITPILPPATKNNHGLL